MAATPASASAPRTLAEALRELDDAELAGLLQHRPDLASPVPADFTQLASRAATRTSVARCVDRLDSAQLAVLTAIQLVAGRPGPARHGRPGTDREAIARLVLGEDRVDVVADVMEGLRRLGLVWWGPDGSPRTVRLLAEVLGPYPGGLGPPLAAALGGYPAGRLRDLVDDLGLSPAADPAGNVERLCEHLQDPDTTARLVAEAGDEAARLLDRLTWGPPSGRVTGADTAVRRGAETSPVQRLLARGLVVAVDPRTVVLPQEIALHLRGGRLVREPVLSPPPVAGRQRDPDVVDRAAAGSAYDAVRRVELLLDTWGVEPPASLRDGGLGVRELRRSAAVLGVDERHAAVLVEVAWAAGLVSSGTDGVGDPARAVWAPTDAFDVWLSRDPAEQWQTLARSWLTGRRAIGLVGGRDERDRPVNALAPGLDRPLARAVRELVLRELAEVPAGSAPQTDDMLDRIRWHRPRAGQVRDDYVRHALAESAVLGVTGLGALATHGRNLLHGTDTRAALTPRLPTPVDQVMIQADLTAVAPGPLERQLAHDLALCADIESRGGATVYRFTTDSLRRALDSGWSAASLHAFIADHSSTPVPQPLSYLVDDVARRHGRLRVGSTSAYVRCDDESLLTELLADQRAADLGLRRVSPTVLVTDAAVGRVLARLREIGRSPVGERTDGTPQLGEPGRHGPLRTRTPRRDVDVTSADLGAVVAAVWAGDRAAVARAATADASSPRLSPTQALARLRDAAQEGATVWLSYVDRDGTSSGRLVEPLQVDGGWLTAWDHRSGRVRSFAVHRIEAVGPASA